MIICIKKQKIVLILKGIQNEAAKQTLYPQNV